MRVIFYIVLAFISLQVLSQSERKFIRQGNRQYNKEKYDAAEVQYRKALEKTPDSKKADYNLANALYKQEKYEAAGTKYMNLTGNEKDRENWSGPVKSFPC